MTIDTLTMEDLPASLKTDTRTLHFELLLKVAGFQLCWERRYRDKITLKALVCCPSAQGSRFSFKNQPALISAVTQSGQPVNGNISLKTHKSAADVLTLVTVACAQSGLWKNWYDDRRDDRCLKLPRC